MTRYSKDAENPAKAAKARGNYLRCHFKHLREIAQDIRGKNCTVAKKFLNDVLKYKQPVTFRRYTGGIGRHKQAKIVNAPADQVRWPQKATRIILGLLENAESNAKVRGLDTETLYITHVQANQAPKQRRRTYRAHGRINAYMSSPGHFELILSEKPVKVPKPPVSAENVKRRAKNRVFIAKGGGVV